MPIPTEIEKYKPHPIHRKAKVTQRRMNFINRFEQILAEASKVRSVIQKLKLEPAQERVIMLHLGLITKMTEQIWRESGLKK